MARNLLGVIVGDKETNDAVAEVRIHIVWELLIEADPRLLNPR